MLHPPGEEILDSPGVEMLSSLYVEMLSSSGKQRMIFLTTRKKKKHVELRELNKKRTKMLLYFS